ncbi:hypothetical protein HH308_07550 [Gordonia sp. TBRC 11910]|uniref:Uncharacterized protein n=1 Tax=Gordonia asplenii TaxID=2725283 RepID=A0A848KSG2_9ACTN|nr:hypothetical protein [Gordonia asplenii]NMO01069.1 hypothetical protein [Gordonia asplenii]
MAPGGGRTDWDSHSIADILAKIQSMDSVQAAADAAALQAAVTSAQAAARRLGSVFDAGEWLLKGKAATAGLTSAQAAATAISASATLASSAVSALTTAGGVLQTARANQFALAGLQAQMAVAPEDSAAIKSAVTNLMNSHYSDPMTGTAVPAATGSAGNSPGSTSSANTGGDTATSNSTQTRGSGTPSNTTNNANTAVKNTATKGDTTKNNPTTVANKSQATKTAATTTNGAQQNSTQKTNTTTTSDKGDKTTPTPARTTPSRVTPDKALDLGRGTNTRSGPSPHSPGGRGVAPGGMQPVSSPLRRLGISTMSPLGTPATGAGSQASPSRSSSSPYGPHAGRSREGKDGRHRVASFLNTTANGEEVVGSLPLVGPPVIGDWAGPPPEPDDAAPPRDKKTGK